jgi:creatinine amidohydrolase
MTKTKADKQPRTIVVLPLGATEQHGPHLPLETDTIIAEGVVARVQRLLPSEADIRFLPTEAVGYSPEHLHIQGTLSLGYAEAIERWIAIGAEQAAQGVCRLVMLNAHGGNSPLMTIVATELRLRFNMLAVATSWTRFALPADLLPAEEKAFGIHGGLAETSVMLALRPDLVDMNQARDFPSQQRRFAADYSHLRAYGPHAFGWLMSDLSPHGVVGDAASASAEHGNRILDHAARGIVELLEDVARFDLTLFADAKPG